MLQKVVLVTVGALWGLLVFVLGVTLSFPSEAASERLTYEVDKATDGGWRLETDGVRPWRVSGARLSGARLLSVAKARLGEPPPPNLLLQASDLAARLELLPLLSGGQVVALDGSLYDGSVTGRVGTTGTGSVVDLVGHDLDLSLYPFDFESFSADVTGVLQFEVELLVDAEELEASEGHVELEIDGLDLSALSVMGLSLDQSASFTEAVLKLEVADGDAKVKKGSFESDLVSIEIDGDVGLVSPLERSRLDLELTVKLADELDNMAKLLPDFKRARDEDATYHFKVSGTVQRPRFSEDRSKVKTTRSSSRSTSRRSPSPTTSKDDPDRESALERLRARRDDRRERISKRDHDDVEAGGDEEYEDEEFEDEEGFEDEAGFEDEPRGRAPFEDDGGEERPPPEEPYYEE